MSVSFKVIVNNASLIQASSEYTKNDFLNFFKLSRDMVAVIRDGIDDDFFKVLTESEIENVRSKFSLNRTFILYPAQHWRHKNHITLIKAAEVLKDKYGVEIDLVFTGRVDEANGHLYDTIKNSSIKDRIKLIGNISKDDLVILYKLCSLVVVPSLHESNSLVILEALAVGAEVVASDIPPNIELNRSLFTIFRQLDENNLAEKIYESLLNYSANVANREEKKRRISEFTWPRTASEYLSAFEKLLIR